MNEEMKEKRAQLKALSTIAQAMIKTGDAESVNDGIIKIYQEQGHNEIHSYRGWQKLGYQVKKGSKALLLWGEPKEKDKDAPTQTAEAKPEGEEDGKFWPLAYVFSNQQVEPLKN